MIKSLVCLLSVYIKIVRLIRNVGDRAYAMNHAAAELLAAGRGTGIGLHCSISACSM